jgi:hypothetical protein
LRPLEVSPDIDAQPLKRARLIRNRRVNEKPAEGLRLSYSILVGNLVKRFSIRAHGTP